MGVGNKYVDNPDLVAPKELGGKVVLYWFTAYGPLPKGAYAGGIAHRIDKGDKWHDCAKVTLSVNGGDNGLSKRKEAFEKYKKKYGA
jgi:predicted chitinase